MSLFFKDITGLAARSFQIEYFKEIQELKSKNVIIVAGRGIGKTLALAVTALWYVQVLSITEGRPMKVVILGGSMKQAKICYNYIMEFIAELPYLNKELAKEPTQEEIIWKDGSYIMPLPASEKSIRGHHPDLLIIDEAAQVDDEILFAAMPMTAPSPYARQIYSTTPGEGFSFIEERWEKQTQYKYPAWKFFNWNAESFLPKDQVELLREALPEDKYRSEIQGLPYKHEGKVFRLENLKKCAQVGIIQDKDGRIDAGVDWGYYPAPTVLTIVQKQGDSWYVLFTQSFLSEYSEDVLKKIEEICSSYKVTAIYTDSTDKGENLRLAARGLPVVPISFKAEKSIMIANLRMLVEQNKIKWDPVTKQELIQQMLSYVYDSKRNDDFVDSLMLAVKANPLSPANYSLEAFLREIAPSRNQSHSPVDAEGKRIIRGRLRELRRG